MLCVVFVLAMIFFGRVTSVLAAEAPTARVQVAHGPYYVGEAFEIQVVATNFEEEPAPEISTGVYGGGVLRLMSISPSTSTSISIINGKMTRVHEVTFVYRYEFTSTRKGPIRVPEFLVTQGSVSESTRSFELEISGVPTTDRVAIDLQLPAGPIFVGQKVPIVIEFQIDRETQRDLVSYQIHVPLFELSALRFLDEPPANSDTQLEIQTEAGILRLPATSRERIVRGRPTLIIRAERTMIAVLAEAIQVEPAKVFISRGVGFRRDIFNQRRATSTEKLMATGRRIRIEVGEVPRQGRPESFAGAVGVGFSLEVTADRSVVQLGEPIALSFVLRGDGDLSSASLPPLDAAGLLDPRHFRIPDESPAGIVDQDGKHFEVVLRVLDAGVREIPALAYSWFDAETRSFQTTTSRPIALSVGAAEVIGADAVARRTAEPSTSPSGNPVSGLPGTMFPLQPGVIPGALPTEESGDVTIRRSSLAMSAANLGIERDPVRLLGDERIQAGNRPIVIGLYGTGLAILFFAAFDARRRAIDPALLHRGRVFKRVEREMLATFGLPKEEGAAALGRVLRELLAELPEEASPALDSLIAECDTLRFAAGGGNSTADEPVSGSMKEKSDPLMPDSLRERAANLVAERAKSGPERMAGPVS
jgi:hypothetical protein